MGLLLVKDRCTWNQYEHYEPMSSTFDPEPFGNCCDVMLCSWVTSCPIPSLWFTVSRVSLPWLQQLLNRPSTAPLSLCAARGCVLGEHPHPKIGCRLPVSVLRIGPLSCKAWLQVLSPRGCKLSRKLRDQTTSSEAWQIIPCCRHSFITYYKLRNHYHS